MKQYIFINNALGDTAFFRIRKDFLVTLHFHFTSVFNDLLAHVCIYVLEREN